MTNTSVSNFEYEDELEKVPTGFRVIKFEIDWGTPETITKLYSALGIREVAWIEMRGEFMTKWVAAGDHGIYLFKIRESKKEKSKELVVKKISSAVIRSSKVVRIRGLDQWRLYLVDINGEKIFGDIEPILRYIHRHYGIKHDANDDAGYAVERLIEYMAKREKESLLNFRDFLLSLLRREFTVEPDDIFLQLLLWDNSVYAFLYKLVSGEVKGYMAEICEEGCYTDTKTLYNIYVKWCNNKNINPLTESQFTIEMERIGFKRVEIHGQSYYEGINLVEKH